MFKLLNFEFRKLIRQKSFYICIAAMLALLVGSAYTTELMTAKSGVEDPSLSGISYLMEAISGSALSAVLAVFIPLFICEDSASGPTRNIVTRDFSRLEIFVAKLIAVLAATVLMTAVCLAAAYLVGTAFWGAGEPSLGSEQIKILLCQLAVIAAYATMFFAISSMLQKVGGSIAICLILPMAAVILLSLADAALAEREIELSGYWIENLGRSLASVEAEAEDIKKALIGAGCYFAASIAFSWLVIMKREY